MCNKQSFETKAHAVKDCKIRCSTAGDYKKIRKLRPYLCPRCDKWHLTSIKKKIQRVISKNYQNKN